MICNFFGLRQLCKNIAKQISVQIAGLCEAEEDRFPRREVLGAGRGRPDVGHGLHARRQAHRQRSQHAPQGESMFKTLPENNVVQQLQGSRQTLMFSATFPETIRKVASEFLHAYLFLSGEATLQY